MSLQFFIQLATSFILGGVFIAAISFMAERVSEKVSGIIMMFPTTIVLGFFFMGIVTSPDKVAQVIPATITPIGLIVFAAVLYVHIAEFISKIIVSKIVQVVLTFVIASFLWFLMAAPYAFYRLTNLTYGIIGYFALVVLSYLIIKRRSSTNITSKISYSKKQQVIRALFMGTMISLVVFLSKVLNPFWGGIFTMFPVATFSALAAVHFHHTPARLFALIKKLPLGSMALFIYAISVMMMFPKVGLIYGTILAYLVSLMFSLTFIRYHNAKSVKQSSV